MKSTVPGRTDEVPPTPLLCTVDRRETDSWSTEAAGEATEFELEGAEPVEATLVHAEGHAA
jgi:hypothetical protein